MSLFKERPILGLGLCFVVAGFACSTSGNDSSAALQAGLDNDSGDGGGDASAGPSTEAGVSGEAIDQPPAPCHANPNATTDVAQVAGRTDVSRVPAPLKSRLLRMAGRPHSVLPLQVFAEADSPSLLFQYFLLDTNGFEPNVFTTTFRGVNDKVQKTATGADCGLPTIGAVRLALEPKPDLPTDPNDVRAFIDVFTDISLLFVINNESGWYEGWMIYDVVVPDVATARSDGHAQFGKITAADAAALAKMGSGQNQPGKRLTTDGNAAHAPSGTDKFPQVQSNVVPVQLSMGAYNSLQQSDAHAYWEFNYTTNWVHPLYELPFTGGFPADFGRAPNAFEQGRIGQLSSLVPGSGPLGVKNAPQKYGDNPFLPRDPDKFEAEEGGEGQNEMRMRFIPSGLAKEILLDVYARPDSFQKNERNLERRLNLAYAAEVARVDQDADGVISAEEGDVDTSSDGFMDNARLFIPATRFNRFAVTREINDGYLAPRFAPSQRAWVLSGAIQSVSPPIRASEGRDGDDR
jgi:hypothetical protein